MGQVLRSEVIVELEGDDTLLQESIYLNSDRNGADLANQIWKALTFIPPDQDIAKSVNLTYDQTYWGNTSHVFAGWPSFQYPGVGKS